ncbi:MAG: RNA 3'-terminal phosphate cyclase [Candidatus Lokiarchaeota archaeon]|nr:RNA 3'-terminal phosphate cyclase [Candidatus Lokiarchaeota archaeon]
MIEINGSYGEGGGQILRSSVALASLTMNPVRITNIRSGRSKPGLRRQHMAGIEIISRLVDAEVKGLKVGSKTIEFVPTTRKGGLISYDIGTAGSISLLLQAVLPVAILAPERVELDLRGGTDVSWSPPINYIQHVFIPIIEKLGVEISVNQNKRGHYPKGGGVVKTTIRPVSTISPIECANFGEITEIKGISHCVRLPSHVAERQARSAKSVLLSEGFDKVSINIESYKKGQDPHLGAGSGIVLWAESDKECRIGADALGAKGKPAEKVGKEAANKLLTELSTRKAVDSHLADMLVPYLALAEGTSKVGITEITSHLETNIWVAQRILGVEIELDGKIGESGELRVHGIGPLS